MAKNPFLCFPFLKHSLTPLRGVAANVQAAEVNTKAVFVAMSFSLPLLSYHSLTPYRVVEANAQVAEVNIKVA